MWSRKPSTLDVSYLNLRLCIGVLGVALPFILRIGSAIFPPDPYSVSAYYYSAERNILVASLCVLGTFLLTYQGYDKLDSRITNICGAATIGVALFPTSNPGFKPAWVGHVHPVVAGIALAGQALMALQFTQSAPRDKTARWIDDVKRMLRALIFRYAPRGTRQEAHPQSDLLGLFLADHHRRRPGSRTELLAGLGEGGNSVAVLVRVAVHRIIRCRLAGEGRDAVQGRCRPGSGSPHRGHPHSGSAGRCHRRCWRGTGRSDPCHVIPTTRHKEPIDMRPRRVRSAVSAYGSPARLNPTTGCRLNRQGRIHTQAGADLAQFLRPGRDRRGAHSHTDRPLRPAPRRPRYRIALLAAPGVAVCDGLVMSSPPGRLGKAARRTWCRVAVGPARPPPKRQTAHART